MTKGENVKYVGYSANTVRPTRFAELGYRNDGPGVWRIYDVTEAREAAIGPIYRSKTELLADLQRYATEYGCRP